MRKIRTAIALLTLLAMLLSLWGCAAEPIPTTDPDTVPTTDPATVPTTDPVTVPTTEPATVPTTEPATEPEPTQPAMTAQDLKDLMVEAGRDTHVSKMEMFLDFEITVDMTAEGVDVRVTMAMDMTNTTMEAQGGLPAYSISDMTVEMLGTTQEEITEIYTLEENGTVVTYTHSQAEDTWTFADTGMTPAEYLADEDSGMGFEEITDLTLDEQTQVLDGREVYVLRFPAPASMMGSLTESLGPMDAGLEMPCTTYVDAQTYLPVKMEMDMTSLMKVLGQQLAGQDDAAMGEYTVDIVCTPMEILLSYEAQQIPELDEDTKAQAKAPAAIYADESLDLGDGRFLLDCGDHDRIILLPEGWYGEVYDVNNVYTYNAATDADATLCADYYWLEDWTGADLDIVFQDDAAKLEDYEIFIQEGPGPEIDGYATYQVLGDGLSYYYAWAELEGGLLLVYIYDYSGTDDASVILPEIVAQTVLTQS